MLGRSKEKPKETEQEAIERIMVKEGFKATQVFSSKSAELGEVSEYLKTLQAKGKKPLTDYKILPKTNGETLVFEK